MSSPAFDLKDRVRQANDIVDLVGSYLTLRRQGSAYVARCPWHDDQRPSLQINPNRQTWKCWVCNLGGDVFSFVMKRDNVSFGEALRILADRAGIPVTERQAAVQPGSVDDKQTLFDALKWSALQYQQYLRTSPHAESARRYLAARRITPASLEKFRIGFAPDERFWLSEQARDTRYAAPILKAIGVLADSTSGSGSYERFRGRVMFPIFDLQNRVVGFGGRILPEAAERQIAEGQREPPKYVNSPETRVFSKSENLYGLNLVRDATQKPNELIVVEGYTDVVAAWQAGLENAVAVLGTALNERHLRLMKRFVERVVLVLDGDEAGRRRANETLELFIAADLDLRVLTLPDNLDPAEYLDRFSLHDLQQLVVAAADAVDHKLAIELQGVDVQRDTHRAAVALENVLQTISRRPSAAIHGASLLREQQILGRVARRFAADHGMLTRRIEELRGRVRSVRRTSPEPSAEITCRVRDLPPAERELLELLSIEPGLIEAASAQIEVVQLRHPASQQVYAEFCRRFWEGLPADVLSVLTELEDLGLKSLLAEIDDLAQQKQAHAEASPQQRLEDVIKTLDRDALDAVNRQAIAQLSTIADADEEMSALQEILERARQRQELASQVGTKEGTS